MDPSELFSVDVLLVLKSVFARTKGKNHCLRVASVARVLSDGVDICL